MANPAAAAPHMPTPACSSRSTYRRKQLLLAPAPARSSFSSPFGPVLQPCRSSAPPLGLLAPPLGCPCPPAAAPAPTRGHLRGHPKPAWWWASIEVRPGQCIASKSHGCSTSGQAGALQASHTAVGLAFGGLVFYSLHRTARVQRAQTTVHSSTHQLGHRLADRKYTQVV